MVILGTNTYVIVHNNPTILNRHIVMVVHVMSIFLKFKLFVMYTFELNQ